MPEEKLRKALDNTRTRLYSSSHTKRRFDMLALTIFCLFMGRHTKSPKVPHARTTSADQE